MKHPNIEGWPNYYISKSGRLFSNYSGEWRELKPCVKSDGYVHNYLYKRVNGKKVHKKFYRHRLVAMVYIKDYKPTLQVCHIDNNTLNNRLSNLYCGSATDNMQQCVRDGRFYFIGTKRHHLLFSRISPEEIVKEYRAGIARKDIISKWNISVRTLYEILKENGVPLRVKRKTINNGNS